MPIPIVEPSYRELAARIRRHLRRVAGVRSCDVVVVGGRKRPEVRLRVLLEGSPDNATVHVISSRISEVVRSLMPNSRVLIRTEPDSNEIEGVWEVVKRTADHEPGSRGAHSIHLMRTDGRLGVDFHLEVSSRMSVEQARDVAQRIETKLKAADPRISEVVIHEETASDSVSSERAGHGTELRWYIDDIVRRFPEVRLVRPPAIRRLESGHLHAILHVTFKPGQSIQRASEVSSRLEASIKGGYQRISRVDVVEEPAAAAAPDRQNRS